MVLDIFFKNRKLEKEFNEVAQLDKIHGKNRAKKIRLRMAALRAAKSLNDFCMCNTPNIHMHLGSKLVKSGPALAKRCVSGLVRQSLTYLF